MVVISGAQCRMARGLLKWAVRDLEQAAGVSSMTVKRLEAQDGVPNAQITTLNAIHKAFTDTHRVRFEGLNGVYLIETSGDEA